MRIENVAVVVTLESIKVSNIINHQDVDVRIYQVMGVRVYWAVGTPSATRGFDLSNTRLCMYLVLAVN